MPELSIRKIIEKTLSGEIRIPSFQRGFVWEPEKVAFFIDSLYKGYPIGSLLFWRTNIRLENERQLGNYSLPEPTKGYAYDSGHSLEHPQVSLLVDAMVEEELLQSTKDGYTDRTIFSLELNKRIELIIKKYTKVRKAIF